MRAKRDRDAAREIAARRTRIERLGTDQAFDDLQRRSALAALDERRQLREELDSIAKTLAVEVRDAEADARALGRRPARSSRPSWHLGDDTPAWQLGGADDAFEAMLARRRAEIGPQPTPRRRGHHATSITARERRSRAPESRVVRVRPRAFAMRSATGDGMPTLFGHASVFNVWTEVDSVFEGNFLEQVRPGAFKKTIREQRDQVRVLFQHGCDPVIGDKPLGALTDLGEDAMGLYYEAPLFDASYVRDLIPGLEAGVFGASFRFRVTKETRRDDPGISLNNPRGIPERVIQEVELFELGPCTWGQYPEATAGLRSVSDEYVSSLPAAVAA